MVNSYVKTHFNLGNSIIFGIFAQFFSYDARVVHTREKKHIKLKVSVQVGEQPSEQVSTIVSTPVQNGSLVSGKVGGKVNGKVGDNLLAVIQLVKDDTMSFAEIYDRSPIRSRRYLRENVLKIAIELGYVGLLYSDAPQHPRQKYYLTEKGKAVLEQVKLAKPQVNL